MDKQKGGNIYPLFCFEITWLFARRWRSHAANFHYNTPYEICQGKSLWIFSRGIFLEMFHVKHRLLRRVLLRYAVVSEAIGGARTLWIFSQVKIFCEFSHKWKFLHFSWKLLSISMKMLTCQVENFLHFWNGSFKKFSENFFKNYETKPILWKNLHKM